MKSWGPRYPCLYMIFDLLVLIIFFVWPRVRTLASKMLQCAADLRGVPGMEALAVVTGLV